MLWTLKTMLRQNNLVEIGFSYTLIYLISPHSILLISNESEGETKSPVNEVLPS